MNNKVIIPLLVFLIVLLVGAIGAGVLLLNSSEDTNEDTQNNISVDQNDDVQDEDTVATDKNDDQQERDTSNMESSHSSPGSYINYSETSLTDDTNIIFFHASWCPTCKNLDRNLNNSAVDIPEGVTILKADYDEEDELKKKYGVTYQHTLVQVDKDGNEINQWSGSFSLEDILENII